MSEILEVTQHNRVLRIALNRPDKHNALNSDLCRELVDAINRANRDPHVGAIVLTGNGDSFSAGMDLKELGTVSVETINNVHEQLFTLYMRLGTPLVAAVNGLAVGGGTGLVANCHIAVASEKAKFGLTEIKLGLVAVSGLPRHERRRRRAQRHRIGPHRPDVRRQASVPISAWFTKSPADANQRAMEIAGRSLAIQPHRRSQRSRFRP